MLLRLTKGFSLLEVLFGVSLVSIVLVALTTVMIGGLRMMQKSEQLEVGTELAREELEQIKTYLYSPIDGVFDGNVPTPTTQGFPPAPYPSAHRTLDYKFVVRVSSLDERLRRVDVEVQSDNKKLVTLSSVIRK
jgi:prepilin-type N-terminal cleavage/methylation domain-containing protein